MVKRNDIEPIQFDVVNGNQDGIIYDPNYEIIKSSGVERSLQKIRPAWKAKNLIQRTVRILPADPSSACQRIFNASIHDLREKVVLAGVDIAISTAKLYKLPSIISDEDILERYDVSKLITLSYRMGLLSRPEYRKIMRVYDIRKDLEHEDDQYEANVADVVYVFSSCIDIILANDPISIIKITDIKDVIQQPNPVILDNAIIEDYSGAPSPRQEEIYQMLISTTLDLAQPDIVRQNSYNALGSLVEFTKRDVLLNVSMNFNDKRLNRRSPTLMEMRVAYISGIMPYIRTAYKVDYFERYGQVLENNNYHWTLSNKHGELLRDLVEVGGLEHIPDEVKSKIVEWLILCYIGESGGYGYYGQGRKVFYSNSGAPICYRLFESDNSMRRSDLESIINSSVEIKRNIQDKFVKRRLDEILDLFN